jgi:hypothetical protein
MIQKFWVIINMTGMILFILFSTGCSTTAPVNLPPAGTVWFVPAETEITVDEEFTLEMHVNTGKQIVAAYTLYLTYPPHIVEVNTAMGINGVESGEDGFLIAVNSLNPGKLSIAGYDIYGKGPGNNLHLLTTFWKGMAPGYIKVNAQVISLNDEKTRLIGTPEGSGAKVKVR